VEGFEVYVLVDAVGGTSLAAHDAAAPHGSADDCGCRERQRSLPPTF
jgi:hypothetical protein